MKRKQLSLLALLPLLLGLAACSLSVERPATFRLEKFLVDVFDPQPGETVVVMVDVPHADLADNDAWAARREMARAWHAAFQRLAEKRDLRLYPLVTYSATGAQNGPLPEEGLLGSRSVRLEELLSDTDIALALTEFSATAPLVELAARHPRLRAASMPMATPGMEGTALAADRQATARRGQILAEKLDRAIGAKLTFTTGHQLYVDLRYRQPEIDAGQLHAGGDGPRVTNLPFGEAYIAPYEGERVGEPSRTEGTVPFAAGNAYVALEIQANRVVTVVGEGSAADELRAWLAADPARRNLAELGLGCNDRAVVTGNVLEDEKALGVHLASGRSDHIGGSVGVDDFADPALAVHWDVVYAQGSAIAVSQLALDYEDGTREQIIQGGAYTAFRSELIIGLEHQLLGWLFVVAVSLNVLAWDLERSKPAEGGIKLVWALAVLVFGPLGLLGYLLSRRTAPSALESRAAGLAWGRALGAAVIGVAGYVAVVALGLGILVHFLPDAGPLGALGAAYLAPFVVGWLALRAPLLARQTRLPYRVAVLRVALAEFISTTLIFAGVYPTLAWLQSRWSDGRLDLADPRFWMMLPLAGLTGCIATYPFQVWLVRRGLATGLPGTARADTEMAAPSLRRTWGALVLSLVLAAVSVGLTVASLSGA